MELLYCFFHYFIHPILAECANNFGFETFTDREVNTVDSRLLEPALIRIIWLFEVRWHSPWICLPNSGKNTLGYSNFSYSKFQSFEANPVPPGPTYYRLKHPQLFEFVL